MRKTIISLVAIAALAAGLHAQAPAAAPAGAAAQKNAKNWKDTAEYDLYSAIIKPDATPADRLKNLDKWKAGYPQSDYADMRQKIYFITYQQLNNHRAAFDLAAETLKTDPNDEPSIREILGYVRTLMPTDPKAPLSAQNKADLDTAEKVARYLLANGNADTVYAPDKKPQGATDAQWAQAKSTMVNFSQFTLGYIGVEEKDNAKAQAELTKTLQTDATNAPASSMLATVLLSQQKEHPELMPEALFEYARAASYTGPNALPAAQQKSLNDFLTKAYTTYHGSAEGLDQVKTLAKASALPPDGFKIKSTVDIAKEDEDKRQKAAAENPMLAFWTTMKEALTSADSAVSDKYWDAAKGAGLPPKTDVPTGKFKGKLISATPETRPKELLIAIEKPDVADAKLVLEEPLPGKMEPGGDISFFGSPEEFSKSPYMVTFKIADPKEDIEGWTGKGPAGPPRTGAKKAPPKKKE
jgi:hypothetical protein